MNLIVAVDENWAIGNRNKLLVSIPADMKFFREMTKGNVVVMGRKTMESFPGGQPLKKRTNIVLSRDESYQVKEILYVKIRKCTLEDKTELFQIAQTFRAEVIDYGKDSMLLEFLQTATKNDAVVKLLREEFRDVEVVRGGSVGIEAISMAER